MVTAFIWVGSVLLYLGTAVLAARLIPKDEPAEAWTAGDTVAQLMFGLTWPLILAVWAGGAACNGLTRIVNPDAVKVQKKTRSAAWLRVDAGDLHRSALLVEDTPAFAVLEDMAADLRRQATALDGKGDHG